MMLLAATAVLAAMLHRAAASPFVAGANTMANGQPNYDVCNNCTLNGNSVPDRNTFNGGNITDYEPSRTYTLS